MSLYPSNPEIGEVFNNRQWNGTAWVALNNPLSVEYTTDGEFDQHTSASANVHGIINSASVVYVDDAKLSDERTPTNGSVTDSKIVSGGLSASAISGGAVVENDLNEYLTESSASSIYATISNLSSSVSAIESILLTKMPFTYSSASPTSPVPGETWFDSSASADAAIPYFYDGNTDEFVGYGEPKAPSLVEYLVLAGGAGGGGNVSGGNQRTGGGGAGGYRSSVVGESSGGGGTAENRFQVSVDTSYTITIGAGGAGGTSNNRGTNGSNSVFSTITSTGGGGGAPLSLSANSGGSGGGSSVDPSTGKGSGTVGQGYDGGNSAGYSTYGGGGGGAGQAGNAEVNGKGGNGTSSFITGSSIARGGGGGGSVNNAGGSGGGGGGAPTSGSVGISGIANTGGGGGGGYASNGGAGGSGVVIIRYPNRFKDATTTGSPTFNPDANGYKVYTFNSSGTIAW